MKNIKSRIFKYVSNYTFIAALLIGGSADNLIAQDFWQATSGPAGGFVRDMALDPLTGRVNALVYANPDVLYQTADGGASWQRLPELPGPAVAITISPAGHIFVAIQNDTGVYRSVDGGLSWQPVPTGGSAEITTLCFDPTAGFLYAGTFKEGIYRSNDGGNNWQAMNEGLINFENLRIRRIYVGDNGNIYVTGWERGQEGGVYLSKDKGATWSRILSSIVAESDLGDVAVDSKDNIFVTAKFSKILKSEDGGKTWNTDTLSQDQPNDFMEIAVLPDDILVAGVAYAGLFRSEDSGVSWDQVPDISIAAAGINRLLFNTIDSTLYAGLQGSGIIRSTDNAKTFKSRSKGIFNVFPRHVFLRTNWIYASIPGLGLFRSKDEGVTWNSLSNNLPGVDIWRAAMKSDYLFVAEGYSGVHRSQDQGITWEEVNNGLYHQCTFVFLSNNGDLFAQTHAPFYGIHRSKDNGDSWTKVYSGDYEIKVNDMLEIPGSGILLAGLNGEGVIRSVDGGANWVTVNTGLGSNIIHSLEVQNSSTILAGTQAGLYKSTDNGDNWTLVDVGQTGAVRAVAVNTEGRIYIGHFPAGAMVSTDGGASWSMVNEGLVDTDIIEFDFDERGVLYAGISGGSVVRSLNSTLTPVISAPDLISPVNGAVDIDTHPEFKWKPVSGAESYTFQLSVAPNFADLIVNDFEVYDTNFKLNPIEAPLPTARTFFWRVMAYDGDTDTGVWSEIWNFTTARDLIFENVLKPVSPPDSASEVSRALTLQWDWIEVPPAGALITYDVQVSTTPDFLDTLWQVVDITGSSVQLEYELEFNRTYYWRVFAKTSTSIHIPRKPYWQFTTEPFRGTANLIFPEPEAENISIPTPFKWTNVPAEGYMLQVAANNDFGNTVMVAELHASSSTDTLVILDRGFNLENDKYYFWRVGVISGGVVPDENWSTPRRFRTFRNVSEAGLNLDFPDLERRDTYQATDYRLVGLPGNSGIDIGDIFPGTLNEDWMAYWDNGAAENYQVPYDGSAKFRCFTGKAFWVINRGDVNISPNNLGPAPLNEQAEALINVHVGYNLITNPFSHEVDWRLVREINNLPVSSAIFVYDATEKRLKLSTKLAAGEGYYFINTQPVAQLRIPYNPVSGFQKPQLSEMDWQVEMDLISGSTGDKTSCLGISGKAKQGLDQFEYNKPRIIEGVASVYFERPEWNREFSIFGSDVRPGINESETWQMNVYTPGAVRSLISFEGIENIPAEYRVVLVDRKASRIQDLRTNAVYQFTPAAENSEFEFVVGKADQIDRIFAEVMPRDFALEQNYPNPFNPVTSIPVALPQAAQIKLTVYNILGKVITTLYNGVAEPGRHLWHWDGTDMSGKRVASGLYFYRLEIEGRDGFTKKMVLIK